MKIRSQIKNILLLNICFLTLVGCASSEGGKNPPSQNEGEDNNPPVESPNSEVTNVFFSELYVGESVNDAILEIGTTSKEPISLRGYKADDEQGQEDSDDGAEARTEVALEVVPRLADGVTKIKWHHSNRTLPAPRRAQFGRSPEQ